jgi:hypothetical protein
MVLVLACGGATRCAKPATEVVEANKANADAARNIEDVNKRFAQLFGGEVDMDDRKKHEPTAKDALTRLKRLTQSSPRVSRNSMRQASLISRTGTKSMSRPSPRVFGTQINASML